VDSTSGNTTDAAQPPRLRTRVAAILSQVGRLGLVALVLGVGWWTLNTLTDVLRDPAQPVVDAPNSDTNAAERIASPAGLETISSLASGGRWEFSDGSAAMSLGTVPSDQLEAHWSAGPQRRKPQGLLTDSSQAWERSLLDLLRTMELKPDAAGTTKTFKISTDDFRAEAMTDSIDGVERLIAARGVIRDDDRWRTLELGPRPSTPSGVDQLALIPYPPGAERLATRFDLGGGVGAEFARVPLTIPALLDHARKTGSEMIFPDLGAASGTREGFCVYNGRTIRVVLWQPQGSDATTILAIALGDANPPAAAKPLDAQ